MGTLRVLVNAQRVIHLPAQLRCHAREASCLLSPAGGRHGTAADDASNEGNSVLQPRILCSLISSVARCKAGARRHGRGMMARPYWSGQLKISLVSFGVNLFPAINSNTEITFHEIDRRTGHRVHRQNVVDGGKLVDNSEIVNGYEYRKGKYLVIEPDEIATLRLESRTTLELTQFVNLQDIPPAVFEKPYFVTPQAYQDEAFAVIREALGQTNKAGIGELAFGGREHLIAVTAPPEKEARQLVAYTLRYGEELRKPAGYLPDITKVAIGKMQLAMATELIKQYSAPLNLASFKDDYETALRKLIDAKQKNKPLLVQDQKPQRAKVANLMDALRKSVDQSKRPRGPQKGSTVQTKSEKKGPVLVKPARRARAV